MTDERKTPNAKELLGGMSPRARGREKMDDVLYWIYAWGCTSNQIVSRLLRIKNKNYCSFLEKKGLLKATKTAAGGFVPGVPTHYYTLTRLGLELAEAISNTNNHYREIDSNRVPQSLLRHNLMAQQLTVTMIQHGSQPLLGWETERQLGESDEQDGKRPDVVWFWRSAEDKPTLKIGVEIELSQKYQRSLDQFAYRVACSLKRAPTRQLKIESPGDFDAYWLFSDNLNLLRSYHHFFTEDRLHHRWSRDFRGDWIKEPEPYFFNRSPIAFYQADENGRFSGFKPST